MSKPSALSRFSWFSPSRSASERLSLTALGRVNFGLTQAFSSRYQTGAVFFWCCLGLVALAAFSERPSRVAAVVVRLLFLAVLVRGANLARLPTREARWHAFQLNAAAAALLTGADDTAQLQLAFPPPDYVLTVVPYMRDDKLSVFLDSLASQLGKALNSVFRVVSSGSCTGAAQSVNVTGAGESQALRITGWAWDFKHRSPPAEIVAMADGVIAGLGAVGDWRPTIRATRPWINTSFIGFSGYARNAPEWIFMPFYEALLWKLVVSRRTERRRIGESLRTLYNILHDRCGGNSGRAHLGASTGGGVVRGAIRHANRTAGTRLAGDSGRPHHADLGSHGLGQDAGCVSHLH